MIENTELGYPNNKVTCFIQQNKACTIEFTAESGIQPIVKMLDSISRNFISDDQRAYVEYVRIGSKCKKLNERCLNHCPQLKTVVIQNGVEYIADSFSYCPRLESINIPRSVWYLDNWVFGYQTGILAADFKVTFQNRTLDEVKAMEGYPWQLSETQIVIA